MYEMHGHMSGTDGKSARHQTVVRQWLNVRIRKYRRMFFRNSALRVAFRCAGGIGVRVAFRRAGAI